MRSLQVKDMGYSLLQLKELSENGRNKVFSDVIIHLLENPGISADSCASKFNIPKSRVYRIVQEYNRFGIEKRLNIKWGGKRISIKSNNNKYSIELKSPILNDEYTQYVYDTFDIQNRTETAVSIPMNLEEINRFEWSVGIILGGSGSGKTTILEKMGGVRKVSFIPEKPLISNFNFLPPQEAALVLTSMGLSSVPSWLKPFRVLSSGEQYRATLAHLVATAKDGDTILVDEFTSIVNREVARAMSFSLQKYIRQTSKRIILASCHNDILEWLMPDWTYSLPKGGLLERGNWLKTGKPAIKLNVRRVGFSAWAIFKKHHYLTENVNRTCKFFLFEWNGTPVGIVATLPSPGAGRRKAIYLSRLVVLPDYQGLGIGKQISELIAGVYSNSNYRVFCRTINPALGLYRNSSFKWKQTSTNRKDVNLRHLSREIGRHSAKRLNRMSFSHEYIGEKVKGYDFLIF